MSFSSYSSDEQFSTHSAVPFESYWQVKPLPQSFLTTFESSQDNSDLILEVQRSTNDDASQAACSAASSKHLPATQVLPVSQFLLSLSSHSSVVAWGSTQVCVATSHFVLGALEVQSLSKLHSYSWASATHAPFLQSGVSPVHSCDKIFDCESSAYSHSAV